MCLWLAETVLQLHYRTVRLLLQEMSLSMNNISSARVILAREKKKERRESKSTSLSYHNCRFIVTQLHTSPQTVHGVDFLP